MISGQGLRNHLRTLVGSPEEELLTQDIIELARQYGRYGYRPFAALLTAALHRNEANGRSGSWLCENSQNPAQIRFSCPF
jgi:hypothetical protein